MNLLWHNQQCRSLCFPVSNLGRWDPNGADIRKLRRFGWHKTWHEALWQISKRKKVTITNKSMGYVTKSVNKECFCILESSKFSQMCKHVTTWNILEYHVQVGIVLLSHKMNSISRSSLVAVITYLVSRWFFDNIYFKVEFQFHKKWEANGCQHLLFIQGVFYLLLLDHLQNSTNFSFDAPFSIMNKNLPSAFRELSWRRIVCCIYAERV